MFRFDVSTEDLFAERTLQFSRGWGIPRKTVDDVHTRVKDMWTDGPGGWAFEWVQEAQRAEQSQSWFVASLLYGAAKFPSLCTPQTREALERQLDCYLKAAPAFPCEFERRIIEVPYRGATTRVPVHLFAPKKAKGTPPLVCLSGGVDTYKMEMNRLATMLVRFGGFRVALIDMPGVGESQVALAPDVDRIYKGVIEATREGAKAAVFGVSFGGHFAAKLGLLGEVDATVNLGGPIGAAMDRAMLLSMPNGMVGVVANALRLPGLPSQAETDRTFDTFSLARQGLFERAQTAPFLAANGAADLYIPRGDTNVFRGRAQTTVWLVDGAKHCAADKLTRVGPAMISWLRQTLHGPTLKNRFFSALTRATLPALVDA